MTHASKQSPYRMIQGQLSMFDLLGDPDDVKWISAANECAQLSLDPSTKTGAVLIHNGVCVATGFNRFPRRLLTTEERLADREQRLMYTIHAELDCLLAGGGVPGTLYTYPWPPCAECAKVAIYAGIRRVVSVAPTEAQVVRWGDSFALAKAMFEEAGVVYDLIDNLQEA
jgi:dCMP deaminase